MNADTVAELLEAFVAYVQGGDFLDHDILSVYLAVDPTDPANQAATPAWQIALKNGLAEIERGLDKATQPAWARARDQVDAYLAGYRPAGKTLVLFADGEDLLDYHLPIRLENRAHYGLAQLKPFLWAIDEYKQYDVVLFGADRVRHISVYLGRATDDLAVDADQTWVRAERKSGHQANYVQRQDELDRRFLRSIAAEIDRYVLEHHDISRIIFGGGHRLAHAARKLLHPRVADMVVGVFPLPFEGAQQEIAVATRELAEGVEREQDLALVTEVIEQARSGGRGALGHDVVGRALDLQAVRTLILPYPIPASATDELMIKAVRSSSTLSFVYGEAATRLHGVGSLAAQLYYAPPTLTH
jgi:hypothetical protein